jgi:hypothetical protein
MASIYKRKNENVIYFNMREIGFVLEKDHLYFMPKKMNLSC